MMITFAGRCLRTIVFDPRNNKHNFRALEELVQGMEKAYREIDDRKPRYHWDDVKADKFYIFLDLIRHRKSSNELWILRGLPTTLIGSYLRMN